MSESLVGKTLINRFRVDAFINSGGMGVVYFAHDHERNTPVAIKVLHSDMEENPSVMRKFKREADALKGLRHSNIVEFYGYYQTLDFSFLVLKYIQGLSLKQILSAYGKALPLDQALIVFRAVSAALGFAHRSKIVHCDVKPGNVMVDVGGDIFLTDFGIARHAHSTTTTYGAAGAPAYMAPEQIKGGAVSAAADVYALGVMLFEMLAGRRPFKGNEKGTEKGGATTADRLRFAQLNVAPPDPRVFNPHISEEMASVILTALSKDPMKRYQTMAAFMEEVFKAAAIDESSLPRRLGIKKLGIEKEFKDGFHPPERSGHPDGHPEGPSGGIPMDPRLIAYIVGGVALVGLVLVLFNSRGPGERGDPTPDGIFGTEPTQVSMVENTRQPKDVPAEEEEEAAESTAAPVSNKPQGHIVFTCQVDQQVNHDQICIMNADGSGWKQLTNKLQSEHYYASLSADGSEIVFSSSRAGGFEIFKMNADGSGLQQLTAGMGEFYAPELSPDGRYIAATRYENGTNHIALLTSSGNFIDDLNSYFDCKDPTWSPDGSKILFAANPNRDGMQFYVMNADGSGVKQITDMSGFRGRSDWGPDGMMATYAGQTENHNRELYFFNQGTAPYAITSGGDNLAPSFSPDGNWITFMSYRDNFWDSDGCEIYIMRLEDGYIKRLTDNNYCDYQPRWSY